MKKQTILNIVMVCLIIAIVAGGVLTVGSIQGWFDRADGSAAVLSDIRGIATMERDGVAYQAQNGTVLRTGDKLSCDNGTVSTISVGDSRLVLGERAVVEIRDASAENFSLFICSGEVFADAKTPLRLSFQENNEMLLQGSVSQFSIRPGTQTISVFQGEVGDTAAGHQTDILENDVSTRELPIESLNHFTIGQLRKSNESGVTCFQNEALDKLEEDRRIQMQEQLNNTAPTVSLDGAIETTVPAASAETTAPAESVPETEGTVPDTTAGTEVPETTAPAATEPKETEAKPTEPKETEPAETQPAATAPTEPETEPETQPTEPQKYVTITIRCDTILDNWDDLDPAKAPYVPADGYILYPTQVAFTEGESVLDVLTRVCDAYGIQIEYSWSPMYGSSYVEGINNLYEFDCGSQSGWMYKVNGWFPNYGCSSYTLTEGDDIVWCYTCKGLGADVGGSVY